jgi:hypothetical protein
MFYVTATRERQSEPRVLAEAAVRSKRHSGDENTQFARKFNCRTARSLFGVFILRQIQIIGIFNFHFLKSHSYGVTTFKSVFLHHIKWGLYHPLWNSRKILVGDITLHENHDSKGLKHLPVPTTWWLDLVSFNSGAIHSQWSSSSCSANFARSLKQNAGILSRLGFSENRLSTPDRHWEV